MQLLRTRPKIRVRVPRAVTPGAPFAIEVLLDAAREVDVDSISVTIVGRVWTRAHQRLTDITRLGAKPSYPRPLPGGTTSVSVQATLPSGAPPTYAGAGLSVTWEIDVHASVPWWPDPRARFELVVVGAPAAPVPLGSTLFATREGGPNADEPYAELSLTSRTLSPRDVLRGAISVTGTAQHRYQHAKLALRAVEGNGRGVEWPGAAWAITVPLGDARDGDAVPFALGVPDLVPSFDCQSASLHWVLGVEVSTLWSRVLSFDVPIMVVASAGAPASRNVEAYPPLGEERVRRVWAAVGERHGLVLEGDALVGAIARVRVQIRRGRGPRGRAEIVGTLEHPPLHLDLNVAPRSLGSRILGNGARSGVAEFDDKYEIRGRSVAQAGSWTAELVPRLGHLRVASMDDLSMRVTLADSGSTERPLDAFAARVMIFAHDIDRALDATPLPPGVSTEAEAPLGTLADALGAALERGHARIEGTRDDARVEIRAVLSAEGVAVGLRIEVWPAGGVRVDGRTNVACGDSPPTSWPSDAQACARALSGASLDIDATRVVAVFDARDEALERAIASALSTIETSLELARALRAEQGPFR